MKKFTVKADDLKPALKKLAQAVNSNSVVPATLNIYCEVRKGSVRLTTTDLDVVIACTVPAETEGGNDYTLLLPFDYVNSIVSECNSEKVTVQHPSAQKATLLCDEDVFEINSLESVDNFPKLPATPKKSFHNLNENFIKHLTSALLTVGKDNMRPSMTRVLLDIFSGGAHIVSTDASVMYRQFIALDSTQECQLQFGAKVIKALDGIQNIELSWTDKKVCFKNETIAIWCSRYEDNYPNYKAVIPGYGANLSVNKEHLAAGLRKCLIANNTDRRIDMKPHKEKIDLASENKDMSRNVHLSIPGTYEGDVEMVALNAKKLLTVLTQTDAEEIKLHLHYPTKAVLLSAEEDPGFLALIMPLIINN